MKTSSILVVGCCLLAMALSYVPKHTDTEGGEPGDFGHWHELDCNPTDACIDNGGYCIRNNKKEDCYGFLFPKECRSPICSCCVEDESKCLRNPCQNNTVCTNTSGSYQCECPPGYNLTAEGCVDIVDDCATVCCGDDQFCTDKPAGYDCACHACAGRCQYKATFIEDRGLCMKLIQGNMTNEEALTRCAEDFISLPFRTSLIPFDDKSLHGAVSALMGTDGEPAWVARIPSDSGNDMCVAMSRTDTFIMGEAMPCATKLIYAICIAHKYY